MALDDGLDDALNIAGYWTLGVTKGFLVAIVPIAVMGLAFGMGLKVVKAGVQIGRVEMMGYLTDIAKTQALIVVAPGVVAGNWVVNRVYGDGTTDQLYEGLLPDAENFATNAAKDLGAMVLTIATEIGSALGDLGDDILKGLQSVGGSIGNATLDVARNIGPAIVDGVENTYDFVRAKLRGKEPDIIAAITVGFLTVLTGVYLFNAAKRGTTTYQE